MGIYDNLNQTISTKYGSAKSYKNGYYRITSRKEGNHSKLLHRLIFEDYYQIDLDKEFPNGIIIHHNDEDKSNNHIWNLIPMTRNEHMVLHQTGEKHNMYGKSLQEGIKLKISESQNKNGLFRVHKHKEPTCKQGFYWEYRYIKNGKSHSICRVDINKLKKTVLEKGLSWIELSED